MSAGIFWSTAASFATRAYPFPLGPASAQCTTGAEEWGCSVAFCLFCKTELWLEPSTWRVPSASIRQQAPKRLLMLAPYDCGAIVTRCHSRDGEGPSAHLSYRSIRHYSRIFMADERGKISMYRTFKSETLLRTRPKNGLLPTG